MARLEDICTVSSSNALIPGNRIWLLNLDMVEQQTGNIISYNYVENDDLNGSIIQFDTDNVLYSKLRPNLNKVVIPDRGGFATSEMLPLKPNASVLCREYLAAYLRSDSFVSWAVSKTAGAKMPRLGTKVLLDKEIPLPPLEEQRRIAALLDKVSDLIAKRRAQLNKLDLLVKARFVEMFGDPEVNNLGVALMPMTEICTIIDGDRGKNYPAQDEFTSNGYCLFLNAKNVTANGFSFENCMFITKEKDEILRKGHLDRGDIILTTRGTIGNLAFYDDSVPYENVRINSGMVILRMNHNLVSEHFFIEQFKILLSSIKEKIASGSAQPQLPISTMNKIMMLMPEIEPQKEFSNFVEQTKRSKLTIQQSLDKLEILKKALMQRYFG